MNKKQIYPTNDRSMRNDKRLLGAELLESYIQWNTSPNAISI